MARLRNQLVIIQPTPFCNINCKYCYLPQRSNVSKISLDTVQRILREVFESSIIADPINIVWHAGEPLSMPVSFYEEVTNFINDVNQRTMRRYTQSIQTNATLINEEWVRFFRDNRIRVGVSIDGPEFIHDTQRVTRSGKGTHKLVMKGVEKLQQARIPFTVIMVLTAFALDYPDEIFEFLCQNDINNIGFNIDEIEGSNHQSSFQSSFSEVKYRAFMKRFVELIASCAGRIRVREFWNTVQILTNEDPKTTGNSTNSPMGVITFDHLGNYSTFCPELIGTKSERYSNFVMGNIHYQPIDKIFENPVFQLVNGEVQTGVEMCRRTCEYWSLCGGGSPSNKYFETGKFDISETMVCRVHKKALSDVMIDHLDKQILEFQGD